MKTKKDNNNSTGQRVKSYSEKREIWKRFKRNKLAVVGLGMLVFIVILAVFAPLIAPYDPTAIDYYNILAPPSPEHPFGTDQFGRDYLSRVIVGSQVSLIVGVGAVAFAASIGLVIGSFSGFYKRLDNIIMRFLDIIFAFPAFFLALAILAYLGGSTLNALLVIGIVFVPRLSRIVRASVMEQASQDYVTAAISIGLKKRTVLFRHIIPNSIMPLIVIATLDIGLTILLEASLSFLGMGSQPPTPSWGGMLADGRVYIRTQPLLCVTPGIAIMFVVIAFNLVGDGLRDALDPKLKE